MNMTLLGWVPPNFIPETYQLINPNWYKPEYRFPTKAYPEIQHSLDGDKGVDWWVDSDGNIVVKMWKPSNHFNIVNIPKKCSSYY